MQTQLRLAAALFCFSYLPEAAQAQTNTATGVEALLSNTTGTANTATGYRALRNNTIGSRNTAIG